MKEVCKFIKKQWRLTLNVKPLLFYMNAGDYPEIKKDLMEIPCDKFIVNFMAYPWPHNLARDYFLAHPEYTHLIVQPQDLHANKEHYQKLIETVKKTGYDIVSCVCNVEREGHRDYHKWAICAKLPSLDRNKRYYNWVPETDKKLGVIRVEFQGMVFAAISRKIIQMINLNAEFVFKGTIHVGSNQFAAAPDLTFCHEMKKAGIPIYANTDIRLIHYANHKPSKVGKELSSTEFIKWHGTSSTESKIQSSR